MLISRKDRPSRYLSCSPFINPPKLLHRADRALLTSSTFMSAECQIRRFIPWIGIDRVLHSFSLRPTTATLAPSSPAQRCSTPIPNYPPRTSATLPLKPRSIYLLNSHPTPSTMMDVPFNIAGQVNCGVCQHPVLPNAPQRYA